MEVEKMSPTEVGKIIKMRAQSVRLGLQQGKFPFRSGNTKTGRKMVETFSKIGKSSNVSL